MKRNLNVITVVMVLAVMIIGSGCAKNPSGLITYTRSGWNIGYSVTPANDNGYVVAGQASSNSSIYLTGCMMKISESGAFEWFKTYSSEFASDSDGEFLSISQTSDGGYIASGDVHSNGYSLPWIVKTDAKGNKTWQKRFTFTDDKMDGTLYSIIECSDGGYLATGHDNSDANSWLAIKLNNSGETEWVNKYKDMAPDQVVYFEDNANSVVESADGGYILTGSSHYTNFGWASQMEVVKIDSDGNVEWSKGYGKSDVANSIKQSKDGGYILAGKKGPDNGAPYNSAACLRKIDSNGNEEWTKEYYTAANDYSNAESVVEDEDGNFIFTGTTCNPDNKPDFWVQKVNNTGNVIWSKLFGTSGCTDTGLDIVLKKNGGYVVAGRTSVANKNYSYPDICVALLDKNGKSITEGINKIN